MQRYSCRFRGSGNLVEEVWAHDSKIYIGVLQVVHEFWDCGCRICGTGICASVPLGRGSGPELNIQMRTRKMTQSRRNAAQVATKRSRSDARSTIRRRNDVPVLQFK
jgi:hypothetical protein